MLRTLVGRPTLLVLSYSALTVSLEDDYLSDNLGNEDTFYVVLSGLILFLILLFNYCFNVQILCIIMKRDSIAEN